MSVESELQIIAEAKKLKKEFQNKVWEQEKIIETALCNIREFAEFKEKDKVLISFENHIEVIAYVSSVALFEDTKDGKVYYRFNKPKKDGTMSSHRLYLDYKYNGITKIELLNQ